MSFPANSPLFDLTGLDSVTREERHSLQVQLKVAELDMPPRFRMIILSCYTYAMDVLNFVSGVLVQ